MKKGRTIISIFVGIIFIGIILTFYGTFSLSEEYKFESRFYTIEDGYIKGISPYTEIGLFLEYFDLEDCSVKVIGLDDNEINSGYVMNGSQTVVLDNSGKAIASYKNVIMGDLTFDGKIDNNDLTEYGRYLVNEDLSKEEIVLGLDVNEDKKVQLSDLLLFDKALKDGYKEITVLEEEIVLQSNEAGRVVAKVEPSYALNQNVIWSSSNESVATVFSSGKVTGHQEGEAILTATTADGSLKKEVKVKVDNTIQLESYYGTLYIGGGELVVPIKSIDYEGITCSSAYEDTTKCRIEGKNLVLTQFKTGTVDITVSSPKYGSRVFEVETLYPQFTLVYPYWCIPVNKSGYSLINSFNVGKLSFDILTPDIFTNVYEADGKVHFSVGSNAGRGEVIVKESNGNMTRTLTIDVYRLVIPETGQFTVVGKEVVTNIIAENGELKCTPRDSSIATCRVEDNKLYVQPLKVGQVIIDVVNIIEFKGEYFRCGTEDFLVVVQEEGVAE